MGSDADATKRRVDSVNLNLSLVAVKSRYQSQEGHLSRVQLTPVPLYKRPLSSGQVGQFECLWPTFDPGDIQVNKSVRETKFARFGLYLDGSNCEILAGYRHIHFTSAMVVRMEHFKLRSNQQGDAIPNVFNYNKLWSLITRPCVASIRITFSL